MLHFLLLLTILNVFADDDKDKDKDKDKEEKKDCLNTTSFSTFLSKCNDPFTTEEKKGINPFEKKGKIDSCEDTDSGSEEDSLTLDDGRGPTCKPSLVPMSCQLVCFDASAIGKNHKKNYADLCKCGKRCQSICTKNIIVICPNIQGIYVNKFLQYLRSKYVIDDMDKMRKVISIIVCVLYHDKENMLMFLAHATFNTAGFYYLKNTDYNLNCKYMSRGLLMITGEQNYRLLDSFSTGFFDKPEKLEILSDDAILVTLEFWKKITRKCTNFSETLIALNPTEVQPYSCYNPTSKDRLSNRMTIYSDLKSFFCACPDSKCSKELKNQ